MTKNTISVCIPPLSNIIIWKKNEKYNLIQININNKKIIFFLNKQLNVNFHIDRWSNSIIFEKNKINKNVRVAEKKINAFLKLLNIYIFNKIKFKGKGFRIKFLKKSKIIKFYFGRSHITFLLTKKIIKKRINKYKFILKSINYNNLRKLSKTITSIKPFNVYTLRGIRLSKQIIFKRKGKKGTYI